ncbi:putative phosphohydrolase [Synechococcus sp. PCC 7502]|uniref:metallophosphoesterase n=1 Tax=Synechococcus sp. PCC 7502 TaxID=1173263 RepID=UPI00029F979A|nr:metallophosphoesterase [Synechococcus sp. PCC 7502]AFY72539.1 putative phosphohydrolase [Synechococcus sp. PCC 7502]
MTISRRQVLFGIGGSGLVAGLGLQLVGQSTIQSKNSDWQFVGVADTGMGDQGQYAVANAMSNYYNQSPYSSVLLAGDNIYGIGEIERVKEVFEQPYAALLQNGVKFYAALGNHDVITNNGNDEVKYPLFNMTSRYYTFSQNQVQFFALDTNIDGASDSNWGRQLQWLEQSLGESKATWKIVFGHHPVYSSGLHGSTRILIESLPPLFEKYKVPLYLCGHDHNYERSLVLNGTTYIVHGGGANTRPVGKSDFTAYSEARLSFIAVTVSNQQLKIKAIDTEGKIFDNTVI